MRQSKACPVCAEHSELDSLDSQLMVLSGVEAMAEAGLDRIADIYHNLTAYDAHTAISMYTYMLAGVCADDGEDIREILAEVRGVLTERYAQAAS